VSQLSRWFVVLGLVAILPPTVIVGGSIGEVLRHPSLGAGEVLRHEELIVVMVVSGVILLSTAAGLHESRKWALLLGIVETGLLIAGGMLLLIGNSWLMGLLGLPEVLALGVIPLGLAMVVMGTRLLHELWIASELALPFGAADIRALGALAVVVAVGTAGHLLFAHIGT
jgi:hypothetical protein